MPLGGTLKAFVWSFAVAMCASTALKAQVSVDVAKITCNQFALYKVAAPDQIAIWLHGYYSGKRDNTVVDIETLKTNARQVRDFCLQNPDVPLMDAVEEVLEP